MDAPALPLLTLVCVASVFSLWMIGQPWLIERRHRRLRGLPFPPAWRRILRRRVPFFRRLPAALQLQLKQQIQVFLAEKAFIGCQGMTITDEVRVTVAACACLLILNRRTGCYPELRQVLVYPGAFIVDRPRSDAAGVLQERRLALSGESWSRGQVILSWQDALEGAVVPDDGSNVVIHEFAHQLDQENGPANGAPWLPGRARYRRWSEVMGAAFAQLERQAQDGHAGLLSHYGATDPAEFFAVSSEVFFEQPQALAAELPAVYRELSRFYALDPLSW